MHDYKALMTRWFQEVWNDGNDASIAELFHPQGKALGVPDPDSVLLGPAGFRTLYQSFRRQFSNIHIAVEEIFVDGDHVAARWTATLVHTGDAPGLAATGKTVTLPGSSFTHYQGGQIIAAWNYMDLTFVYQNLAKK
ncbi:MAG: ester cyclase [Acidobacteriaceae bacterium]|nr:ester cyclase [Acidobacteriaceae bacterium]